MPGMSSSPRAFTLVSDFFKLRRYLPSDPRNRLALDWPTLRLQVARGYRVKILCVENDQVSARIIPMVIVPEPRTTKSSPSRDWNILLIILSPFRQFTRLIGPAGQ